MLTLANKIKIFRKTDGAYIVDRGTGKYLFFNESATDWISLFQYRKISIDEALVIILEQYPLEVQKEVTRDFKEFVEALLKNGYLVEKEIYSNDNITESYPLAECEPKLIEKLSSVTIEVTERCNEHCLHCYLPDNRKNKGQSLTIQEIQNCIDQLMDLGLERVTFTGGEAMLHPNLIEAIRFAKSKNLYVSVLSNLTILTHDIMNIVSESDDTQIKVSLYAITEEIHDYITGLKGSCKRTKDAILELKKRGVSVSLSMVVMKENYQEICNMIKFAKENDLVLQFDYVMMARSDFDNSNLLHRMTIVETEQFFRMMLEYDLNFGLSILKKNDFAKGEKLESFICHVATDGCCISSNGDVYLCPSWQDIPLGNIKEQNLFDIWNNNATLSKMRDLSISDIKGCKDCDYINFCCICLARNYYENDGDMFIPTKETCDVAKLGKRLFEEYSLKQDKATV